MPFTALIDTMKVDTLHYRGEWKGRLCCPECGDKMHYVSLTLEPFRVAFYRHNPSGTPGGRQCSFASETEAHRQAKQTLLAEGATFFRRSGGQLEYTFTVNGRERRADVYFPPSGNQYGLALEAQYSPIQFADDDGNSIEERTRDYHAAGIHIVWCIETKRGSDTLTSALKRIYGSYGEMPRDGSKVAFIGTNSLFLNKHPMQWMADRYAYRKQQLDRQYAKEQAERDAILARQQSEEQAQRNHLESVRQTIREREQRLLAQAQASHVPVSQLLVAQQERQQQYIQPAPAAYVPAPTRGPVWYAPVSAIGKLREQLMELLGWPPETLTLEQLQERVDRLRGDK